MTYYDYDYPTRRAGSLVEHVKHLKLPMLAILATFAASLIASVGQVRFPGAMGYLLGSYLLA